MYVILYTVHVHYSTSDSTSLINQWCIHGYRAGHSIANIAIPTETSISHHFSIFCTFDYCYRVIDVCFLLSIVYTNNEWAVGEIIEEYGYTKVQQYLLILHRWDYFAQLQQQSLAHQQQLIQLQQQLDTERRMSRSMALQLDKLQESNANKSHSNTSTGNTVCIYTVQLHNQV